jgi:hypothetical protein
MAENAGFSVADEVVYQDNASIAGVIDDAFV